MTIHLVSGRPQPSGRANAVDADADVGNSSTDGSGLNFASVLLGLAVAAKPSESTADVGSENKHPSSADEPGLDIPPSGLGTAATPPVPVTSSDPIVLVATALPAGEATANAELSTYGRGVSFVEQPASSVGLSGRSDTAAPGNRPPPDAIASFSENPHSPAATVAALTSSPTMPAPALTEQGRAFQVGLGDGQTSPLSGSGSPIGKFIAAAPVMPVPFGTPRVTGQSPIVETDDTGVTFNLPNASTAGSMAGAAGQAAIPSATFAVGSDAPAEKPIDSSQMNDRQTDAVSAADLQLPARIAETLEKARQSHLAPDRGQADEMAGASQVVATALADNPFPPPFSSSQGAIPLATASNQPWHAGTTAMTQDLSTPFHDSGWHAEFGQKVLWLAGNDHQQAHLTLNPPHLGAIEITVNLNPDSSATAAFVAADADVRNSLESSLPRLREMFAQAGIDLGHVSVGSESFRQSPEGRQQPPRTPRGMADKAILSVDLITGVPSASGLMGRNGGGRVDTFA
ncbi:MAG: flagellar hook-length control protein FliK [Candidatus Accumulibacter sp.]|nr:flagellar hook-length control protein FliK [Accumulibacter sp.]